MAYDSKRLLLFMPTATSEGGHVALYKNTKLCPKDTFLNFSTCTCIQKELNHAPTLFPKV